MFHCLHCVLWGIFAVSSAIDPSAVCLVTDHEPVPRGRCSLLAKLFLDSGLARDKPLPADFIKTMTARIHRSSNVFSADFARTLGGGTKFPDLVKEYNRLIPCLNRHYACRQGYSFFMPSSPWLTVARNRTRIPGLREELKAATATCDTHNIKLPKGWKGDVLSEGRRSQTWCKVLLLRHLLTKLPGCEVVVFLDADLLLVPPDLTGSPLLDREAWAAGSSDLSARLLALLDRHGVVDTASLVALRRDRPDDFQKLARHKPGLLARLRSWDAFCAPPGRREGAGATRTRGGGGGGARGARGGGGGGGGSRRSGGLGGSGGGSGGFGCGSWPLHEVRPIARFLAAPSPNLLTSTTQGGRTFGHEQWADPAFNPYNNEEALASAMAIHNNVNNTHHSTSFMVLKNNPRTRMLLTAWWNAADPRENPNAVGQLGEPLRMYRSAWAHEQRVLDDFVAAAYPRDVVGVSGRSADFNTPQGLFAQHYFAKDKHLRQYATVALGAWGAGGGGGGGGGGARFMRGGSCLADEPSA